MKTIKVLLTWTLLVLLIIPCQSCTLRDTTEKETYYYGIEINDVLCGYYKITTYSYLEGEKEFGLIRVVVLNKLSVLEGDVDITIENELIYDPEQEGYISQVSDMDLGKLNIHSTIEIKEGIAYHYESSSGIRKEVEIGPDVIVELPIANPHLFRDFINDTIHEKSYQVFDDKTGDIIEKKYSRIGEEELMLAGQTYQTLLLEEIQMNMGLKSKLWLEKETEFPLKYNIAQSRLIFLADESVVKRISIANLNDYLFAKVDKVIQRSPELAYMKVRARVNSVGEWCSVEKLNFPGQKFTGTVEDNLVDGIFEIEPIRYHGENAPGFPYDFELVDSLQKYLEPEFLIESNEDILVSKAKQITNGASDSWEATILLSKWVNKNIDPAIPGGTSAINTYRTREGECGSHTRLLTAFCRGVGIPARFVMGCAYIPQYGGCFGQHAWTEVYMGETGWVAIDATFGEVDYVDAGHIRFGEQSSFHPEEMEILEYRHQGQEPDHVEAEIPEKYQPYIGKYKVTKTGNNFEILYKDEHLAVDIPNKMVLLLDDPDEEGRWYPQLSKQINFTFHENEAGEIAELQLQQIVKLTKSDTQVEISEDTPAAFHPYIGSYKLLSVPGDFKVFCKNGILEVDDPTNDLVIKLHSLDEPGSFGNELNEDEIHFKSNEEGSVESMVIYGHLTMPKTELVAGEN